MCDLLFGSGVRQGSREAGKEEGGSAPGADKTTKQKCKSDGRPSTSAAVTPSSYPEQARIGARMAGSAAGQPSSPRLPAGRA